VQTYAKTQLNSILFNVPLKPFGFKGPREKAEVKNIHFPSSETCCAQAFVGSKAFWPSFLWRQKPWKKAEVKIPPF